MYLFHVSKINRNKDEIDMSSSIKNDIKYAYFLIDAMNRYQDFHSVFNSKIIQMYATEKDWTKEKIAVEAVFEYIRLTEYPNSPSRLLYTYFTDSFLPFYQKERPLGKLEGTNLFNTNTFTVCIP